MDGEVGPVKINHFSLVRRRPCKVPNLADELRPHCIWGGLSAFRALGETFLERLSRGGSVPSFVGFLEVAQRIPMT